MPFQVEIPAGADRRPAPPHHGDAAARTRSSSTTARRACSSPTIEALARYWTTEYDMRRVEARLNALPQFTTEIDGVDIHFIHVRSQHEDALPLIMTHGWPGSVIELLDDHRPAHRPDRARRDGRGRVPPRRCRRCPATASPAEPTELGWYTGRTAQAWAELMRRLGYTRYVAQGGDVGRRVTDAMGRQAPDGLIGIHTNLLAAGARQHRGTAGGGTARSVRRSTRSTRSGRAASATSSSSPRGRRPSATRCWTRRSRWRRGCSTTTPTATTRSPAPSSTGSPTGDLTRDHILDNITLYWLTATGRLGGPVVLGGRTGRGSSPPARRLLRSRSRSASRPSPARSSAAPRSWAEAVYPTSTYFNEADKGGHFAAWEEPELFSAELRAAFRSLR